MERLKKILTKVLIGFTLISIGFSFGKHSTTPMEQAGIPPVENERHIAVYYLHSTFRCVTCNTIETLTRELLENSYSNELSAGSIRWIEVDFQENESLAKQFEVVASCVVVAEMKDGVVTDYKRLDEVWTLMEKSEDFNNYISDAINGYLKTEGDS